MSVNTTNVTELTAEQVQRILVKPLEASAVFLAAGPRIFDTNGSPVRVPKLGGPITDPGWPVKVRPSPSGMWTSTRSTSCLRP